MVRCCCWRRKTHGENSSWKWLPRKHPCWGLTFKYQRVLYRLVGEKTHQWCHPEVNLEWLRKASSLGLWSPHTCSQRDRNRGGSPQNWGPTNGFICIKDNPTAPENEVISSYKTDGITSTSLFIFIFAFLYVGKWISVHRELQSAQGMVNITHMCVITLSLAPAHHPMYHHQLCRQRNRGAGQSCSCLIAEPWKLFLHRSFLGHLSKLYPQWPERKVGLWRQRDKKIWTLKDTWLWKGSEWQHRLGLFRPIEGNHLSSLFFALRQTASLLL